MEHETTKKQTGGAPYVIMNTVGAMTIVVIFYSASILGHNLISSYDIVENYPNTGKSVSL